MARCGGSLFPLLIEQRHRGQGGWSDLFDGSAQAVLVRLALTGGQDDRVGDVLDQTDLSTGEDRRRVDDDVIKRPPALLSVESGIGDPMLILTLVVIVIGGMGSIRGALIGSLLVGVFDTLSRVIIPHLVGGNASSAIVGMAVYILMAAVLLYSRTGLFGAARG